MQDLDNLIKRINVGSWVNIGLECLEKIMNLGPWLNRENLKISIECKFVLLEIDSISTNFAYYDFYLPIFSGEIFIYFKCLQYHDVVKK